MGTHALVGEVPLLDAGEVDRARATVHAARPHWRPRHDRYPFYTLGTASYLDACQGRFAGYQAQARETNPVLGEQFGWLFERLRDALATYLGAHVAYDDRLALPGFHIFLCDPRTRASAPSVHFDMQYNLVDWTAFGSPDVAAQLSLTLPLQMPAAGGGLWVWNINRLQLDRMSPEAQKAHSTANRVGVLHSYAVGRLVIHSGHQLHQIASTPDLEPGDERITLQAHALPVDGRWIVYW